MYLMGGKSHLKAFNSNNMDEMENTRVGKSLVMVVVIESAMSIYEQHFEGVLLLKIVEKQHCRLRGMWDLERFCIKIEEYYSKSIC